MEKDDLKRALKQCGYTCKGCSLRQDLMCVTHIHKAAYELICKLEEQEKQAKCAVLNELKEKVDRCYVGNSMPEIIDEMIEELKK